MARINGEYTLTMNKFTRLPSLCVPYFLEVNVAAVVVPLRREKGERKGRKGGLLRGIKPDGNQSYKILQGINRFPRVCILPTCHPHLFSSKAHVYWRSHGQRSWCFLFIYFCNLILLFLGTCTSTMQMYAWLRLKARHSFHNILYWANRTDAAARSFHPQHTRVAVNNMVDSGMRIADQKIG